MPGIKHNFSNPQADTGDGTVTQPSHWNEYHVVDLVDAKGDLIVATANDTVTRLPVGSDYDMLFSDSSASTGLSWRHTGWLPWAWPVGSAPTATATVALSLAANGGSAAYPVWLNGWINLDSVVVRNTDTTLARTWGWDLYRQDLTSDNVLTRVARSNADESYTASAASNRTITAASAPVVLSPGVYWIVIQNRHASNTFGLGTVAGGTMLPNLGQTKTTTNPNGSTLDFTAATWTKVTGVASGIRLQGRVFGQGSAF